MMEEVHPSLLEKKIIHVDMDAYYASVEIRDNPELKNKPVIVGGSPEGRGIVLTCNYVARKFGIRSAMPAATAIRKCRNAIFVRPRFQVYTDDARRIRKIFKKYTDKVQPMSLDEAYLDVTGSSFGPATTIAEQIRADIRKEIGITASAGVAPNKMIAKIASDFNKPDGLTVVRPEQVADFMARLEIRRIPGVGPKAAERLKKHNFVYGRDILDHDRHELLLKLGSYGLWLVKKCRGLDSRNVANRGSRKSIGAERTFFDAIIDPEAQWSKIEEISQKISTRLKAKQTRGRTVTLKIRTKDFVTKTRSVTLAEPTDDLHELRRGLRVLYDKAVPEGTPIRLLGVSVTKLTDPPGKQKQISLFGD